VATVGGGRGTGIGTSLCDGGGHPRGRRPVPDVPAFQSTSGDVRSAHTGPITSEVAMTHEAAATAPRLREGAIGLREVLFQSITDMAPGAAIAASIPFGAASAGGPLPLAVGFALIACPCCSVSA